PDPTKDCVYKANVYNFEAELQANVPGIVQHQFLVQVLYNCEPVRGTNDLSCTVSRNFFYNVTPRNEVNGNNNVWGRNQTVQDYSNPPLSDNVEPSGLNCVYVMDSLPDGGLVKAPYESYVAQVHDPINYPN